MAEKDDNCLLGTESWHRGLLTLELPVLAQSSHADSCSHVRHVFSYHRISPLPYVHQNHIPFFPG